MRLAPAAFLAVSFACAQDFPAHSGYVNDFANQLSLADVQSLEQRVRDYERATSNEIAVAIAPSLNGMAIEDYAQGLFRAWKIGKYGKDNGVLFVWAPAERKFRLQVGRGLESTLTRDVTDRIIARVRELFRAQRYPEGVNAAVDDVIAALAGGAASSPPPSENGSNAGLIAFGAALSVAVLFYLLYRRRRAAWWRNRLPEAFIKADEAMARAERQRAEAQVALGELRREAPREVWEDFEVKLNTAPGDLARLRTELDELRLAPRTTYAELRTAYRGIQLWNRKLAAKTAAFAGVPSVLYTFRLRRGDARALLQSAPSDLAGLAADDALVQAATETYNKALHESERNPANWLLVYDLMSDVKECIDRVRNPSSGRYRPVRCWAGDFDSPASDALAAMYVESSSSSSSGSWDSGSSGGDFSSSSSSDSGGGGFGGGDSGGGGSSGDY
jgi:uncharacterized protein